MEISDRSNSRTNLEGNSSEFLRPILIDANGAKRRRSHGLGWTENRRAGRHEGPGLPCLAWIPVVEVMGWSRVPLLGNRTAWPAMATLGSTVVLFGGDLIGDDRTWIWDGTKWTSMLTWPRPPARICGTMASMGSKVVLFGGATRNTNQKLNDTWEFDGTTWTDSHGAQ